ncbi:hypothetical protein BDB01DRAFT_847013 [Pilobolus umbonatus]|nr:hypothetical protein BDB01DRAFT_847013 [Pilobolus umbonatus]
MTDKTNAGIIQVGEQRWIPGSYRADGTYRKERKVRPGFVPLEDVQRYSNARMETARGNQTNTGGRVIPGSKRKEPVKVTKESPGQQVTKTTKTTETIVAAKDQPIEKKIKALNKKIRQVNELEQKLVRGETLNEEQHEKIKKGGSLKKQLSQLMTTATDAMNSHHATTVGSMRSDH